MNIDDYTISELEDLIRKRKMKFLTCLPVAEQLKNLKNAERYLKDYINVLNKGIKVNDFKNNCFELFVEMFYGESFWEWYNNLDDDLRGD